MIGRSTRRALWLLVTAFALATCADAPLVRVENAAGVVLEVEVRVARTEAERRQGLQGMEPLRSDEGLWIEFPAAGEVCIVNEGVDYALDLVFVLEAEVVALEQDVPAGDSNARCYRADAVLELNAGSAGGVVVGDRCVLE